MGDGVKVNDTGEEFPLSVGLRGPIGNLSQDLDIASIRTIEARSIDKCDFCPCILKRVRLDLAGAFPLSAFESNFYRRGLSYKNKDRYSLGPRSNQRPL